MIEAENTKNDEPKQRTGSEGGKGGGRESQKGGSEGVMNRSEEKSGLRPTTLRLGSSRPRHAHGEGTCRPTGPEETHRGTKAGLRRQGAAGEQVASAKSTTDCREE